MQPDELNAALKKEESLTTLCPVNPSSQATPDVQFQSL
jgi:hypothetical protein